MTSYEISLDILFWKVGIFQVELKFQKLKKSETIIQ